MATFQGMQVAEVRLSGLIALTRTHQLEFVRTRGAIVKLLSIRFRSLWIVKPTGAMRPVVRILLARRAAALQRCVSCFSMSFCTKTLRCRRKENIRRFRKTCCNCEDCHRNCT
ncbi:PREDICTED: uncharacterized protein LOC107339599 isoform X3 [Acropora digitifera]|uniref:uncharacterized protein LOC107339599 isoform X3 n=1 Tax=Acropora digitifera TaxID=70779 RepID=UPI00077A53CB|nr:PREDICTED: uncharacterized protein LOC107339599 isoform X3 [Acropora digitifera]